MGMGFLSSIERVEAAENEDADPVGGARDPVARFTDAAVDVGLIRPEKIRAWTQCRSAAVPQCL
ncbi:hypothetical protein [Variovorax sp. LjRoot178]|uniref:hypothetical protein n=1 Tax=Variovorax sp. LjRoot178 TaxID=3342277 RepID=UPI003F515018